MAEAKQAVPSLVEAVGAATLEIGELIKDETNTFGGYNYVPIDRYYEVVPAVAIRHGLVWKGSCTGVSMIGEKHVLYHFRFSLSHVPSGEDIPDWQDIPIIHPLQGAQTTGSALSYADKLMMRTTFKIVTGEKDADASDGGGAVVPTQAPLVGAVPAHLPGQAAIPAVTLPDTPASTAPLYSMEATGPADVPQTLTSTKGLTREEWVLVQEGMVTFIPNQGSADELNAYWRNNKVLLSNMKDEALDLYEGLLVAFKTHKANL